MLHWTAYLGRGCVRLTLAVLLLLVGWAAPAHAGLTPVPSSAGPDGAVVVVFTEAGPVVIVCSSRRSAWCIQYAYCGGDPVNRWDPSGLDWVAWDGDVAYYYSDKTGSVGFKGNRQWVSRQRIGTRGAGGLVALDQAFIQDGRGFVEIGLLNQHASRVHSGDYANQSMRLTAARMNIGLASGGQIPMHEGAFLEDVQAAQGRGLDGAGRVIAGTATTLGSMALAIPSGGATVATGTVGLSQAWAGIGDIWNADDPDAGQTRSALQNAVGDTAAYWIEGVSSAVTAPGLAPSAPGLRAAPSPRPTPSPSPAPTPRVAPSTPVGTPATIARNLRAGDLGLPEIATNRGLEVLFTVQRGEATISVGTLQGAFSGHAFSTVRTVIDNAAQLARQSGAHSLRVVYVQAEPLITRIVQRLGYVVEEVPTGIVDELWQTKSFVVPLK